MKLVLVGLLLLAVGCASEPQGDVACHIESTLGQEHYVCTDEAGNYVDHMR